MARVRFLTGAPGLKYPLTTAGGGVCIFVCLFGVCQLVHTDQHALIN